MLYEMITFDLRAPTIGDALKRLSAPSGKLGGATLLGFWSTEIGVLNRIVTLWAHEDGSAFGAEDEARWGGAKWEWLAPLREFTEKRESGLFRMFPFLPDVKPGKYGRYYELRSYDIRQDGLPKVLTRWEPKVPARVKLSPLVAALYAVSGGLQKYVHFWPYDTLDQRIEIRRQAIAEGIWPPGGGIETLTRQENSILIPAPFSPLQ